MIIKKVAYTKTYPIGLCWEKIFVEMELSDGDDARNALYEAKKTVENFHYESNKATDKIQVATIQTEKPLTQTEKTIAEMNTCTEIKVLETYSLFTKNNERLKTAYDKKYLELQSK